MAVFKCKMCGGALEIKSNKSIAICEYCGSKQTLPQAKDEVIQNLFNRANTLRLKCEFDKAEQIYEKILQQDDTDAEAHWGIILCKYGIEYVEDPKTFKLIPTCHRTSYDAITADADYIAAIENADMLSKNIYAEEAKIIDEIQNKILSVVKNEKPFDVFICYKETDETGKRTIDSAVANDIFYQLTQEGLKVFYAAITLEDKIGQEYEPYIFAALSSAKVMLVIGTKPEYFNAVWVKNEWSRYIKQMKNDRSKLLIPCYKGMDAYELPEEFAHLQAQDISKIGFINDIVRGIKKVIDVKEPKAENVVKETVVTNSSSNTVPLLKRVFMFLEDCEWDAANEYCEKVLDIDPENAQAYLGKLMSELNVRTQEQLKYCKVPFDDNKNYKKVLRFADDTLRSTINEYIVYIKNRDQSVAGLEKIITEDKFDILIKQRPKSPIGYIGKSLELADTDEEKALEYLAKAMRCTDLNDCESEELRFIVNHRCCGDSRITLLMIAAFRSDFYAVKYLVENGAEINAESANNVTALWYVCHDKIDKEKTESSRNIARYLLAHGAKADVTNKGGVALYNKNTDPEIAHMIKNKFPDLEKGEAAAKNTKEGCYVATCVYGSYDCPQVWTLRRFRDNTLASTWYGRAFIKTYYAVSPTLVKWFGETKWFKNMWKGTLDRMVKKLRSEGVESTPYEDRNW